MPTRGTRVLYWDPERSEALRVISGTETIEDVTPGESYELSVDHAPGSPEDADHEAEFALAEPPRVVDEVGVRSLLCCDGTDGTGFKLVVEIAADYVGYDYGYGGAGADVILNWTRRGVLNGPAS